MQCRCGAAGRQRCGGCRTVAYCSRACQQRDWARHKPVCSLRPGDLVRLAVRVEADTPGLGLAEGTLGTVHAIQDGLFEVDVDDRLYDCRAYEVARADAWYHGTQAFFGTESAFDAGRTDAAVAERCLALLAKGCTTARRHFFLGVCLLDAGREGEPHLRQAVALDPSFAEAHIELCLCLEQARQWDELRAAAAEAVTQGVYVDPWQRPGCRLDLAARPWWDCAMFPWVQALEARAPAIRAAVRALEPGAWSCVGGQHRAAGEHDAAVLEHGEWLEHVVLGTEAAPSPLLAVVGDLGSAQDLAARGQGEVVVSRLGPRTRVAAHCAPANTRLTCHLGLEVPPDCALRVGEEWRTWEEGRAIVFDDSFEHEVRNDSDAARTVLLVRFWHPDADPEAATAACASRAVARRRLLRTPPLCALRPSYVEARLHGTEPCRCGSTEAGLQFDASRELVQAVCAACRRVDE